MKNTLYYMGISCIIISCIMPIVGVATIPMLHLSTWAITIYSFVMIFGFPELLFILGVAIVGKEVVTQLKQKCLMVWCWIIGKKT